MAKLGIPTEAQEQAIVVRWLKLRRLLYCSVPNEARRSYRLAAKLKRTGMVSGVPDLLIFDPPPKYPSARGVAIEMKRSKHGVLSDNQEQWIAELNARGWLSFVAHGAQQAISQLQAMGF